MAEGHFLWKSRPALRFGPYLIKLDLPNSEEKIVFVDGLMSNYLSKSFVVKPHTTVSQLTEDYQKFFLSRFPESKVKFYFSLEPFRYVSPGNPEDKLICPNGQVLFPVWSNLHGIWTNVFLYESNLQIRCQQCGKSGKFPSKVGSKFYQVLGCGQIDYFCVHHGVPSGWYSNQACRICGQFGKIKMEKLDESVAMLVCQDGCGKFCCRVCGKTEELKTCSHCYRVRYCSRACQVQDYPRHKNCPKLVEPFSQEKAGNGSQAQTQASQP